MSLLAIVYHLVPDAPILVAYNRDALRERVCPTPSIQSGKPRVLASIDPNTSGTCLGINQNGMLIGLVRRKKRETPVNPQSRAFLCRELMKCKSARSALDLCLEELHGSAFGGANFVIADSDSGWVVQHTDETDVVELQHGLSVVGENDVDDPRDERVKMAQRLLTLQTLDSPVKFLAVASKVFARELTARSKL